MSKDKKKLVVLACLLMLWAVLILSQRYQIPATRRTQVSSGPPPTSSRSGEPSPLLWRQAKGRAEIPSLKLEWIRRVRPRFEPEVRNIFASIGRPPPLPPSSPSESESASTPATPAPPDPFLEEAKRVRFLGYAEAEGKAMAFVAYGGEVRVISEMEEFGSQFRVEKVKEDALILGSSLDGMKKVLLELSPGPGPLAPGGIARSTRSSAPSYWSAPLEEE